MSDDVSLHNVRVFVSYPRGGVTHTWAERVQAELSRRGANVWRDTDGIADSPPLTGTATWSEPAVWVEPLFMGTTDAASLAGA